MTITAKFSSICPNCRLPIQAGEKVEWNPGSKAVHLECPWTSENCEHPQFHKNGCNCKQFAARKAASVLDADDQSFDAWTRFQEMLEKVGVYVLTDHTIVKIQMNRDKTGIYTQRLVEFGGLRLTEAGERVNARYEFAPEMMALVRSEGRHMTREEAENFSHRYGFCIWCGRSLVDARSVAKGIGPVCAKRFPEGTTAADLMGVTDEQADREIERQISQEPNDEPEWAWNDGEDRFEAAADTQALLSDLEAALAILKR